MWRDNIRVLKGIGQITFILCNKPLYGKHNRKCKLNIVLYPRRYNHCMQTLMKGWKFTIGKLISSVQFLIDPNYKLLCDSHGRLKCYNFNATHGVFLSSFLNHRMKPKLRTEHPVPVHAERHVHITSSVVMTQRVYR